MHVLRHARRCARRGECGREYRRGSEHLTTVLGGGGSAGDETDRPAAARARDILSAYAQRYWRYPNRDNVLGPSRLFFSTYLESLWTCNYIAAAALLRAADQLDEATERGVNQVVEEAATVIGEYDEGFSNRQTWNNAALAAAAVWFEDEELAQPGYLEVWEVGLARLGTTDIGAWLQALYKVPPPTPELQESYLHEAGAQGTADGGRSSLSWWSLLEMLPELPAGEAPWEPKTVLLESQGLAVLRRDGRYVSLECGPQGGGHGHPDRLQLMLHADGVDWLPDPGTGSYVTRDLFWYRSTLAHNAPRLDGESQPPGNASCECFDDHGEWAWVQGRFNDLLRMIVTGPAYVVDMTMLAAREEQLLELPWHAAGRGEVHTKGRWDDDELADEFVTHVQRFVPVAPGPVVLSQLEGGAQLTAHLVFEGALLEMEGPGVPGERDRAKFYVVRTRGRNPRIVTVLEPHKDSSVIRAVRTRGDAIEIETTAGLERHRFSAAEWIVEREGQDPLVLRGRREQTPPFVPRSEEHTSELQSHHDLV